MQNEALCRCFLKYYLHIMQSQEIYVVYLAISDKQFLRYGEALQMNLHMVSQLIRLKNVNDVA